MKKVFLTIFALSMVIGVFAQRADASLLARAKAQQKEVSDPAAKAILDKVRKKYEAFKTLQLNFTLEIQGEIEETQKGKVSLKGDSYRVEMKGQDIISNGNTVWFHLKTNNEVQINNPDPSGENGLLSPADMLKLYDQNLIYALVGESNENGKAVHKIEFKPRNDRDAEFFKMRLTVDKANNTMTKVIAFSKDGTRFIVTFDALKANPDLPNNFFTFDPSKHPNIHVEDLREE